VEAECASIVWSGASSSRFSAARPRGRSRRTRSSRQVSRSSATLSPLSAAAWVHIVGAFRRGMRDLGYVEGANVDSAFRFTDGQVARLPALANELVALNPAVIAVGSPAAVLETHKATRTIPIVIVTSDDPTALGLAASLARPGGNVPVSGSKATRR
jgi:ABC-type uncharacterized transport system substrate-binding protein